MIADFRFSESVGEEAGDHAEEGSGRLGEPGDESDRDAARAEGREKDGEQRIDHLARDVHEEAHPAEGEYRLSFAHGWRNIYRARGV